MCSGYREFGDEFRGEFVLDQVGDDTADVGEELYEMYRRALDQRGIVHNDLGI